MLHKAPLDMLVLLMAYLGLGSMVMGNVISKRQAVNIVVDLSQTHQKMDGFGVSQAFGTAYTIGNLPPVPQRQALDYLFNRTTGAGITILRNLLNYAIEPKSPGSATAAPTYTWDHQDSDQVFVSKSAQAYGVNTFYADAWSAPSYMKTNNDVNNGGYLCGVTGKTCPTGDWRQPFANLIAQYIKDYASEGIKYTQVGFLNEPEFAPGYASMLSDGTQAASFIKILYPTLKAAGLDTGITCCDAEGWNDQKTFTKQLQAAGVEHMLSRITSHSYTSRPDTPIDTNLPVWQSEFCDLTGPYSTIWYKNSITDLSEGLTWANLLYTGIVNANLSGYIHWYGVNTDGGAGTLVNVHNGVVEPSAKLWAFGQWSRYVRPGAVRLTATASGANSVLSSAFKNVDGTISVQVINNGGASQTFSVSMKGSNASIGMANAFITNNANLGVNPYAITISGGAVTGVIPAYTMITVLVSARSAAASSIAMPSVSMISTPSPTMAPTPSPTAITNAMTTPAAAAVPTSAGGDAVAVAEQYGQCGGVGYTGATSCRAPYSCVKGSEWWSQCL